MFKSNHTTRKREGSLEPGCRGADCWLAFRLCSKCGQVMCPGGGPLPPSGKRGKQESVYHRFCVRIKRVNTCKFLILAH